MTIQGTLEIINSRIDIYGNRYFAFNFREIGTDKSVCGTTSGGASNIEFAAKIICNNDWEEKRRNIHIVNNEIKIREYNRLVKSWPYAGCSPDDIAKFIVDNLS